MLQAWRGVPFAPLLRGSIEGITPVDAARLLRGRDRLRRGVLTNVVLHARLERRYSEQTARDARKDVKRAGFNAKLIEANVRKLGKLVRRLEWAPARSEWSEYTDTWTYDESTLDVKERFVDRAVAERSPRFVWDLGCNDGHFSRIAARHAAYVVAVDADQLSVDRLYRALREDGTPNILPLTMNLADPSPDQGWRLRERQSLAARGKPDTVLALALVHHLAIGAGVPVASIADWLADFATHAVVEVPSHEDEMVQRLLARKRSPDAHPDYTQETFAAALRERFGVVRTEEVGTRVLYELTRR
jgi:hypothetical protein